MIAAEGYQVIEASDGEQALEYARQHSPDLVFMDVGLPKLDGYQATYALKHDPLLRHIPVIILSGKSPAEDNGRSFAAGAAIYVRKPLHKSQLRHVLELIFDQPEPGPAVRKENTPHSR
jgi:CheY-like chemotaxis protein